jgi:hypothetical protein
MTPLEALQRWEHMGGEWRLMGRSGDEVQVALLTCTGGEEVDRIVSSDPDLLAYLASHPQSPSG